MPSAPVPDAASIGRPTATARQRDPWLLCLAASLWLSVAWLQPLAGFAALAGLCLSLLLCKTLAMAPSWRAFVAPMPTFAALPFLAAGRAAVMGALLGAGGYLAFTLLRRALYPLRAWLDTYRFRTPDGQADGWDYGRWLLACG